MLNLIKILFCSLILLLLSLPIIIISLSIKMNSNGPIFYWSKRVGKNNKIFMMPKFRTMKINSPQLATSIMENHKNYITSLGKILRKLSIDEIPQIYSIIKGDMNFIGPRPALFNQFDLIELRKKKNIHKMLPGITGWAQVNGRDELSIEKKVEYEYEYILKKTIFFDFYIIILTVIKVFSSNDISH